MSKFTLEVCADSVESILAAEKGGADGSSFAEMW